MTEQHIINSNPLSTDDTKRLNEDGNFHLTLFSDADEILNLWIPQAPNGFYRFSSDAKYSFISIEVKHGQWIVCCAPPAYFQNVSPELYREVPLSDGILLHIECEERNYSLYVEKSSRKNMIFRNYPVISDVAISIGSQPNNDIFYNNQYCAAKHAILTRSAGKWRVQDCGSHYGIYINGKKTNATNLSLGDMVYIMGLKIIIGPDFISINDGDGRAIINKRILRDELSHYGNYSRYSGQIQSGSQDHFFNRLPRKRTEIEDKTIVVEGPPLSMERAQMPLVLRMGGSMVRGGYAALTGNFTTLLSSVLFPLLSSKYTEKQRQEYEACRNIKYRDYLETKRKEIIEACSEEQQILNYKYPSLEKIVFQASQKKRLWERRPIDSDFLCLRVGIGKRLLSTVIDYPEKRFELESDSLEDRMYELVEAKYMLSSVPVTICFVEDRICGLLGPRQNIIDFIYQLAVQTAVLHSYDEVKMVFLIDESELETLDCVRYLPHVWDTQRSIRFIATCDSEVYKIGEHLQDQLPENLDDEENLHRALKHRPYYLVFALDKKLFDGHEIWKSILQAEGNHGVSIITAYDDLPKECQKIIELKPDGKHVITSLQKNGGENVNFTADSCDTKQTSNVMRLLANTRLKTVEQAQNIPKAITFLEMFRVGRVDQLNPLKRWRENNPTVSLAAPVGVGTAGSLFVLDLHEKHQGPHGLVAGMTGSGKSEFLITYILSMAINYHPNEVAFVLIDYKGGGLTGAFENPVTGVRLPHLVGTITNLDGASVRRSLMSIESELIRRQKIFNQVKSAENEGTMDIYAYQKLYRAGRVSDPMPHLFIVSDEFAELKQQQPEFMEKLISTARIGRSLGVHLILATQKPSGVVNDQIRSNTKFRVCLRVQERSDSMDMLKRPEAAELTDTGRFYLQVGYNEYFAMGQSAWCGAPYEPQDSVVVQRDDAIEFLDTIGQVVSRAKPKVRRVDSGMKQIVAVVNHLSDLAKAQNIKPRQLWKPELPSVLELDEVQKWNGTQTEGMSVRLALVDDTDNQEQFPLDIDFRTCQNLMIVGESGSGKTVLLQNILYSLAKQLSPEEFNFYALDYSSRMLKLFKPLPHCGGVLLEEDENDLDEFFKLINGIVARRKKIFSELEVESFDAARLVQKMPLILVAIDNIAGLGVTKKGEKHLYALQNYLKNSANYGIKYVVTCSRVGEVSSRIRQELGARLCMHLADKFDYNEVLGCRTDYIPPAVPGRGLVNLDDRPLEFHAGMICADADDKTRMQYIKDEVSKLCRKYGVQTEAQRLPVLQEDAEYSDFAAQFGLGRIPLGFSVSTGRPVALPLKQYSTLGIYFGNPTGRKLVVNNILYTAQREGMELWIIKRLSDSLFDGVDGIAADSLVNADFLTNQAEDLKLLQQALMGEMSQRRDVLQSYYAEHGIDEKQEGAFQQAFPILREKTTPILLLLEDVGELCSQLDRVKLVSYSHLLGLASQRNIYVVGCFFPDTPKENGDNLVCSVFKKNELLLLGGRLDRQTICNLPAETEATKLLPYNMGLMQYRKNLYPILIPCGKIEQRNVDEDLESIF